MIYIFISLINTNYVNYLIKFSLITLKNKIMSIINKFNKILKNKNNIINDKKLIKLRQEF